MAYLFGIDGGGTSSRLRIEDLDGTLLYYGEGGSTNPNARDRAEIEATLESLFAAAWTGAGLTADDCVAGFAGSAGVDRDADRTPFEALLRRATGLRCPIGVGNDAEPALAGALDDTEGILLIAGTGSIAFGRSRDGFSARAGGWGHLLGDEGSAWRIAFDAICRGLRSSEGRDLPSGLLEAALGWFGLSEAQAMIPFVYGGLDKTHIARFARRVGALRDAGDALAIDLFERAALDLAGLVGSVHARIAGRLQRRRLAFRGGLIESDPWLRDRVAALVGRQLPDLVLVPAVADAAKGACVLARSLAT